MFFWFIGVAPACVAEIFRSPMIDFRYVLLGVLFPLLDVLVPTPLYSHTLVFPVFVLTVVMLSTINRRLVRRRWLGFPIGLFMHLILDGSWTNDRLLLWPLKGWNLSDVPPPEVGAALPLLVILESAGVAGMVWSYRRYRLGEPENRKRLIQNGQLDRSIFQ